METLEQLTQDLGDALARLHDPTHTPAELVGTALGAGEGAGPDAVHAEIVRLIEDLRPSPEVPPGSRARRDFDILYNRYVLGLTQEETADRVHVGLRTVQRGQRRAIHAMAAHIWQRYQERLRGVDDGLLPNAGVRTYQAADWRSQAREELALLRTRAPDAVSQVEMTIDEVLHLGEVLTNRQETRVELGFIQPGLVAAVHPVALRQVVIAAITRLARYVSDGNITIYARLEDGEVRITLTALVAENDRPSTAGLAGDTILPDGGSLDVHFEADTAFLSVRLPSTGTTTVLVVDDNPDMLQFYRRSTAGTRYRLLYAASAHLMFDAIRSDTPDIIVLDVMLPDADGWQVLIRLHEDPDTRSIPVIVASVVREEELALSLGAARYLAKPVHPHAFVPALDEVLRG